MIDANFRRAIRLIENGTRANVEEMASRLSVTHAEAIRVLKKIEKHNAVTEIHSRKKTRNKIEILKLTSKRKTGLVATFAIFLLIATVLHLTGYLRLVANIYPIVGFEQKETTLNCTYAGKQLTVKTQVYRNVNNYYHFKAEKEVFTKEGDFSNFVYSHSHDETIKSLASKIKQKGYENGIQNDQLVELTTCFVQNIPYDQSRYEYIANNGGNDANFELEQFPYETLYRNSGICTDKTYLASALLKELGYGTGIFVLPDAEHMALGVSVPAGYGDLSTNYAYMEVTNTGFAPGEVPSEVDDSNGKPAFTVNKVSDLTITDDPSKQKLNSSTPISSARAVIDVNIGNQYSRIVPITNLERKIASEYESLVDKTSTLDSAFKEITRRDALADSAYSKYLGTPSTTLDCGYKYNFSYSFSYGYSSPYTYRCDTVTNPQKGFAYSAYTVAFQNYQNQVSHYNKLLSDYNASLNGLKTDINNYKQYIYN